MLLIRRKDSAFYHSVEELVSPSKVVLIDNALTISQLLTIVKAKRRNELLYLYGYELAFLYSLIVVVIRPKYLYHTQDFISKNRHLLRYFAEKLLCRKAKTIVFNSDLRMEYYREAHSIPFSKCKVLYTAIFALNLQDTQQKDQNGIIHIGHLNNSRFLEKDISELGKVRGDFTITGRNSLDLSTLSKDINVLDKRFSENDLFQLVSTFRSMLISYPQNGDFGNAFQSPSRICYALLFGQVVISGNLGVGYILQKFGYKLKEGSESIWLPTWQKTEILAVLRNQLEEFNKYIRTI